MKTVGRIIREDLIEEIKRNFSDKGTTFVIRYSKISGPQMNNLRKELKTVKAKVFVSRNNLAAIALKQLKYENLIDRLEGQTAFIWTEEDAGEVSKALVKFAKELAGIRIHGGVLDGAILEKADIERLSGLPAKDVLRSQLLQVMLSPMTRLAYVLNAKTQDLLSILKQLSEKKGGN